MKCSVINCPYSSSDNGISIHRLPKNPEFRQKWIEILKLPSNAKRHGVCNVHFSEKCFLKCYGARRLLSSSVPNPVIEEVSDVAENGDEPAENNNENQSVAEVVNPQQHDHNYSQSLSTGPNSTKKKKKKLNVPFTKGIFCQKCLKFFVSRLAMENHMLFHEGGDLRVCSACSKMFLGPTYLEKHKQFCCPNRLSDEQSIMDVPDQTDP